MARAKNEKCTGMEEILERVRDDTRPKTAKIDEAEEMISQINELLKKSGLKAICVPGGSYAKETRLKDSFDIDLFVRFDYSYRKEDLSKLLEKAISALKPELVHGSRDYFQITRNDILFELIPVLSITDYKRAVNVTDMSPLHVEYVRKHAKAGATDDIRLAKQFCKANSLYGAESYIRGFSGHVLDLLIIFYGGFENLLMQASVWGKTAVIDPAHHLKDPLKELDKSKLVSPLVIVDPVQPDRNAAAAISDEKFELFKKKAREFLDSPSRDFFTIKKLSSAELKKKAGKNKLLIVKASPLDGKDDIVGTKMLKCHEHIGMLLKDNEFSLIESGWEFDRKECLLYYILKDEKLPEMTIAKGPPTKAAEDALRFKARHKKVFEKDKRLFAEEKRKYRIPEEVIRDAINGDYVKERVKRIALVR